MQMHITKKTLALLFAVCAFGLPLATLAEEAAPEVTAADVMFTEHSEYSV
jgi:hypothetical protein